MYSSYNYVHLIYLGLCPFLLVLFYFLLRNARKTTQSVFLLGGVLICAGFEFFDMFAYIPSCGWQSILWNLPLYACDLNIFILFFAIIESIRCRVRPILFKFIMYFTTTGPVFTLFWPEISNGQYMWYSNEILGTFLPHILYIVIAILFLKFNKIKLTSKQPWKVGLIFQGVLLIVHGINLALICSGMNPNSNYMFTITAPNVPIALSIASLLGSGYPYIRSWLFMAVGYIIMTALFYGVHRLIELLYTKCSIKTGQSA